MKDLEQLRREIDAVDDEIIALFARRMAISGEICQYKSAHGLPIYAPEREETLLKGLEGRTTPELLPYTRELFRCLMDLSKRFQAGFPSS